MKAWVVRSADNVAGVLGGKLMAVEVEADFDENEQYELRPIQKGPCAWELLKPGRIAFIQSRGAIFCQKCGRRL